MSPLCTRRRPSTSLSPCQCHAFPRLVISSPRPGSLTRLLVRLYHHHRRMCRFVIYKGTAPVQLSHLLTRPCHSIINQAFDSRLRLDHRRPINGDGFGVGASALPLTKGRPHELFPPGWYDSIYDEELGSQPCIFTSVTPVLCTPRPVRSNVLNSTFRRGTT